MPTALVIGARNLGYAVIRRLLEDGWSVAGGARSPETLEKVRAAGADALEVDVTDQDSVLAALREVAERHGRIDLVVNAASPYGGARRSGPFGVRALTQAAAAELREHRIQVALLIVDATIDRSQSDDAGSADPRSLADAVAYLAAQSPRAMTHELMVTPALDTWVP